MSVQEAWGRLISVVILSKSQKRSVKNWIFREFHDGGDVFYGHKQNIIVKRHRNIEFFVPSSQIGVANINRTFEGLKTQYALDIN